MRVTVSIVGLYNIRFKIYGYNRSWDALPYGIATCREKRSVIPSRDRYDPNFFFFPPSVLSPLLPSCLISLLLPLSVSSSAAAAGCAPSWIPATTFRRRQIRLSRWLLLPLPPFSRSIYLVPVSRNIISNRSLFVLLIFL